MRLAHVHHRFAPMEPDFMSLGTNRCKDLKALLRQCLKTMRPSSAKWCGRRDLNPHSRSRQNLNLVCLPIPPRPRSALSRLRLKRRAYHGTRPCASIFRRHGPDASKFGKFPASPPFERSYIGESGARSMGRNQLVARFTDRSCRRAGMPAASRPFRFVLSRFSASSDYFRAAYSQQLEDSPK